MLCGKLADKNSTVHMCGRRTQWMHLCTDGAVRFDPALTVCDFWKVLELSADDSPLRRNVKFEPSYAQMDGIFLESLTAAQYTETSVGCFCSVGTYSTQN